MIESENDYLGNIHLNKLILLNNDYSNLKRELNNVFYVMTNDTPTDDLSMKQMELIIFESKHKLKVYTIRYNELMISIKNYINNKLKSFNAPNFDKLKLKMEEELDTGIKFQEAIERDINNIISTASKWEIENSVTIKRLVEDSKKLRMEVDALNEKNEEYEERFIAIEEEFQSLDNILKSYQFTIEETANKIFEKYVSLDMFNSFKDDLVNAVTNLNKQIGDNKSLKLVNLNKFK